MWNPKCWYRVRYYLMQCQTVCTCCNLAVTDLGLNKDEYMSDLEPTELLEPTCEDDDVRSDERTPTHIKSIVDSVDPSIPYECRQKLEV